MSAAYARAYIDFHPQLGLPRVYTAEFRARRQPDQSRILQARREPRAEIPSPARELWRKRVGVEPTRAGVDPTHTGFEDRDDHRTTCASASDFAETNLRGQALDPQAAALDRSTPPSTAAHCESFLRRRAGSGTLKSALSPTATAQRCDDCGPRAGLGFTSKSYISSEKTCPTHRAVVASFRLPLCLFESR